jgi:hypothetical protein
MPDALPELKAGVDADGVVHLAWERSSRTIGLEAEVHRGPDGGFTPDAKTLLAATPLFDFTDAEVAPGERHYAIVLMADGKRSPPIRAKVAVPPLPPPAVPVGLVAAGSPGRIDLKWPDSGDLRTRYHVYRAPAGTDRFERLTSAPTLEVRYSDPTVVEGVPYTYTLKAVNRAGIESAAAPAVVAEALPVPQEPVFVAPFESGPDAALFGGGTARCTPQGKARVAQGSLDLEQDGWVTFDHRPEFDLDRKLAVECWVRFTKEGQMPVVVSCGHWQQAGWFLQRIGGGWRWHVGGIDCDGGQPAPGRWTHLVGTFDGRTCRLFQDGKPVAEAAGDAIRAPWPGPLFVGQYSGGPAPPYQVTGFISGLRMYNRAFAAVDAAKACREHRAPKDR